MTPLPTLNLITEVQNTYDEQSEVSCQSEIIINSEIPLELVNSKFGKDDDKEDGSRSLNTTSMFSEEKPASRMADEPA